MSQTESVPSPTDDAAEPQTQPLDTRLDGLPLRARRLLRDVRLSLDRRDAATAEAALARAAPMAGKHVEFLRLLGLTRLLQKRHEDALTALRAAMTLQPADPLILTNLGSALRANGDADLALMTLRRACELAPDLAAGWHNLGQALSAQAYTGEAREAYAKALRCDPNHIDARISHGDALKAGGSVRAAAAEYRHVLAQAPGHVRAFARIANLKTVRFDAREIDEMRRLVGTSALADEDRATMGFALAKALEDEGDYEEAFTIFTTANALKRRLIAWDAETFNAQMRAIAAVFPAPLPTASPASMGEEVIFVVSLPRSGSSLTEQILASHSDIEGAGELSDVGALIDEESRRRGKPFPLWVPETSPADWRRLGEDYLKRTERWRRSASKFTDKALANWRYVGALMAMLPGARFVNVRRDPVETCLACFRQLFGKGHGYAYDLSELAAYWHDYDRLMRYWHARYPHRIFDLIYEDMVAEPEPVIRKLLAFSGVPFDANCLSFHETPRNVRTPSTGQVREPMKSGTARAPRYGDLLAPLRLALGVPSRPATH